jgi:hypothetical protein
VSTNRKLYGLDIRTVLGSGGPWVCCGATIVEMGGDTGAALTVPAIDVEEPRRISSVFIDVAESLAYSQV